MQMFSAFIIHKYRIKNTFSFFGQESLCRGPVGYKSHRVSTVNTTACLPKVGPHAAFFFFRWSQAASRLRQFAIEDLQIRDRKSTGKHKKGKRGFKAYNHLDWHATAPSDRVNNVH